jgi:hypothetical protein
VNYDILHRCIKLWLGRCDEGEYRTWLVAYGQGVYPLLTWILSKKSNYQRHHTRKRKWQYSLQLLTIEWGSFSRIVAITKLQFFRPDNKTKSHWLSLILMTNQDALNFQKSTLHFVVLHANHLEQVLYNLIIILSFLE